MITNNSYNRAYRIFFYPKIPIYLLIIYKVRNINNYNLLVLFICKFHFFKYCINILMNIEQDHFYLHIYDYFLYKFAFFPFMSIYLISAQLIHALYILDRYLKTGKLCSK